MLNWGIGARALSLGRAYTSLVDDPTAVLYNPACLTKLNKIEFMGNYTFLYEDSSTGFIGVAVPFKQNTAALGIINLSTGDLIAKDNTGQSLNAFGFNVFTTFISIGRMFYRSDFVNWSSGISLKILQEKLADTQAGAYTIDWGNSLTFDFGKYSFIWGMNLQNFVASKLKLMNEEDIPVNLRIGSGISLFENQLNLGADLVIYAKSTEVNFGIEYNLWDLLNLRVGVNERELGLGLGLKRKDMQFNYAISTHRDWQSIELGWIQTVDVKIKWTL